MKKVNLSISLAMLAVIAMLLQSTANGQDEKQQAEFQVTWHDTCYKKKDVQKCYELSRELVEKYPKSTYFTYAQKNIQEYEQNRAWEKFQADLKAYYAPPQDAAKLDQLFATGESYLKFDAANQFVAAHLALAGANGALGQFYKDFARVKRYGDTALKSFSSPTPPQGWKQEDWSTMRDLVLAQMNQYLGWMLIYQSTDPAQVPMSDQERAIEYLTLATQIKGKDGVGWKDPHNYWLRSIVYSNQCTEVKKSYDAMTDEEKTGDAGKEILKKINELLDTRLIPEYARVLATATKPETRIFYDAARPEFDRFWKFRTDAPDRADAYVQNYVADPTIASMEIPAKAESAGSLAAPMTGPANIKLSAGAAAIAPGAGAASTGSKSGRSRPAKGKAGKGGAKRKGKKG